MLEKNLHLAKLLPHPGKKFLEEYELDLEAFHLILAYAYLYNKEKGIDLETSNMCFHMGLQLGYVDAFRCKIETNRTNSQFSKEHIHYHLKAGVFAYDVSEMRNNKLINIPALESYAASFSEADYGYNPSAQLNQLALQNKNLLSLYDYSKTYLDDNGILNLEYMLAIILKCAELKIKNLDPETTQKFKKIIVEEYLSSFSEIINLLENHKLTFAPQIFVLKGLLCAREMIPLMRSHELDADNIKGLMDAFTPEKKAALKTLLIPELIKIKSEEERKHNDNINTALPTQPTPSTLVPSNSNSQNESLEPLNPNLTRLIQQNRLIAYQTYLTTGSVRFASSALPIVDFENANIVNTATQYPVSLIPTEERTR